MELSYKQGRAGAFSALTVNSDTPAYPFALFLSTITNQRQENMHAFWSCNELCMTLYMFKSFTNRGWNCVCVRSLLNNKFYIAFPAPAPRYATCVAIKSSLFAANCCCQLMIIACNTRCCPQYIRSSRFSHTLERTGYSGLQKNTLALVLAAA